MGIFSGEKYSREGFEKAKKGSGTAYENALFRGSIPEADAETRQRIYDELWDTWAKAKKRVEKLYAGGQTEAIALNKKYKRLRTQAREAIKALADFEREKLGMHKENPDSPSKEAEEKF